MSEIGILPSEAKQRRRRALTDTFRLTAQPDGRRLTGTEVRQLCDELEDWLAEHPDHDAGLHEGKLLADADMEACPQCNALTLFKRSRLRIERDLLGTVT